MRDVNFKDDSLEVEKKHLTFVMRIKEKAVSAVIFGIVN